ncbi:MSHA biogenesis protein mshN [Vibrio sp. JCM 19236]|nr:MSHA biogenesis protein mshN [Vibrio sp. JCM 19236]
MSVVNSALTKLAQQEKQGASNIERAEIPKLKKTSPVVWIIGGFSLSLALGGFAVSQQQTQIQNEQNDLVTTSVTLAPVENATFINSPTKSAVQTESVSLFQAPKEAVTAEQEVVTNAKPVAVANTPKQEVAPKLVVAKTEPVKAKPVVQAKPIPKPILIAKAETKPEQEQMKVEQVELTAEQLAEKSIARAEKALNANDVRTAFSEYNKALKLVPTDENTRQKLAAIYYGRKDTRRAVNLLQQGIRLNEKSEALRLALAKLLVKEQQPEAALSSLSYMPDNASEEYLALRAGLAQQTKNVEIAEESYKELSERDPTNARWWLGLAIQQERQLEYADAKESYTKALGLVGISKQTQAFIRDRLQLLNSLEGEE